MMSKKLENDDKEKLMENLILLIQTHIIVYLIITKQYLEMS